MPIWLFTALGAVRRALAWIAGIAKANPLLALLALSLALSAYLYHGKQGETERADRAEAKVLACNDARVIDRKSITTLEASLNDQSARVRDLAKASDAQQKRAQNALRVAVERGKASEASAVRIERAVAPSGCVTAREIMSARGEL